MVVGVGAVRPCIGDPAVNYDWNPASRPAHITNALKSKETPK
jgi:hypothetical protein